MYRLFFLVLLFSFEITNAQVKYVCDRPLTIDLKLGMIHDDVLIFQKYINSGKNIQIATSGPGSKGRETNFFGSASEQALIKFKKMNPSIFSEFSGVLDKFTRDAINKDCYKLITPKLTIPAKTVTKIKQDLQIKLSTDNPNPNTGAQVKILLDAPKAIKRPEISDFIIDNITNLRIYKLSSTKYQLSGTLTNSKAFIMVEAERILATDNSSTNFNSSNSVEFTAKQIPTSTVLPTSPNLFESSSINSNNSNSYSPTAITTSTVNIIQYIISVTKLLYTTISTGSNILKLSHINYSFSGGNTGSLDETYQNYYNDNPTDYYASKKTYGGEVVNSGFLASGLSSLFGSPSNENYIELKNFETLNSISLTQKWITSPAYNYSNLTKYETLNCSKIFTHNNTQLVFLKENSETHEFYISRTKEGLGKLLIYPKWHRNSYYLGCVGETESTSKFFPNGLFCCTSEPCNSIQNISPITYELPNDNKNYMIQMSSIVLGYNNGNGVLGGVGRNFLTTANISNQCKDLPFPKNINDPILNTQSGVSSDSPW